jgi:ABC-type Fe3+-hydroxamate transport system substrate-binding protein
VATRAHEHHASALRASPPRQVPVFRLHIRVLALLAVGATSAGCGAADTPRVAAAAAPRDDFGTPIAIGKPPTRIVSLNPTTTEILFAIGAGKRLVGRSQYDTYPDSAKTVASLGPALRPSVEAIVAAKPDLVILYASEDNRPAFDRLRQAGIPTVAFKLDSIEQFRRDTRLLGRITGDSAQAVTVVDSVSATLERVRRATANLPKPTVFIPTWEKPIIAIGGGSFLNELVEIAGGTNIYKSVSTPSATVTIEDVVMRNPDFVVTGHDRAGAISALANWRAIPAVRDGHILTFDFDLVSRPSVQLGASAVAIAKLLHPGAVP